MVFLLAWITVIAALTGAERRRGRPALLPGDLDDKFRAALAQGDSAALCHYYRLALSGGVYPGPRARPRPREEQLVRINLACALNGLKQYRQALDELDRVALRHLSPAQVVLWLNNRAYTLTLLGQPEDALDHLRDADDLLAGDDGLPPDPTLAACIAGTRGIALYHKGDLDGAERALQLALRLEDASLTWQSDPDHDAGPARTAERWWWLSQIAGARGDGDESRVRLRQAAIHPLTEFGSRALHALHDAPPQ